MKKTILLSGFLLAVLVTESDAQTSSLQIGVGAGRTTSDLSGTDYANSGSRTSAYFGGSVVFHKPESKIGLESGAYVVHKGVKGGFDSLFELMYLEFPALVRYGFNIGSSKVMPVVLIGATFGIKGGTGQADAVAGSSIGGSTNAIDLGLSAGAAIDLALGSRFVLSPTVRYTHGLLAVGNISDGEEPKNRATQFGVALRFKL
jgi:hypothetical protein